MTQTSTRNRSFLYNLPSRDLLRT